MAERYSLLPVGTGNPYPQNTARHAAYEAGRASLAVSAGSGPLMGRTGSKEREALTAYLKDCDENAIVPDVGGAWHAAFEAGRASLAASAGSEPVAQPSDAEAILSKICDLFHIGKVARTESTILTNIRNVIDHAGLLHAVERDLFPQPELPEDDDPYAAVDEGLPAPNSWAAKDEADYVAQFRAALAARGFTHPSPPEGMVGGWIALPGALPKPGTPVLLDIGKKYPIRAMWAAKHTVPAAGDDTDWGEYDEATDQYWCPEGWYEWNEHEDTNWAVSATPRAWASLPPTTSAGSGKGE